MKIAVLSRNPKLFSTQRLIEEIQKAGHAGMPDISAEIEMIIEQEGPSILYKGQKLEGIDAIIPRIGASVTFYGTAVVRQFELMGAFSAVTSQAIVRSRDKLLSLQILSKNGLGMPKTAFTNFSKGGEKQLIEQVSGAPVIIKLLEGTQGLGVVLAETKKAAQSVVEAFHGLKARIIVQEYIKEAKGSDIRAFVVNGKVVGAMKRQGAEGEFRSNLHRGGVATVIKLSRAEKQAALNAAKALGLDVAGVDMLQSLRGPLILEVNSSPGLEGIEGATGVNVAAEIIKFVVDSVVKKSLKREKQ